MIIRVFVGIIIRVDNCLVNFVSLALAVFDRGVASSHLIGPYHMSIVRPQRVKRHGRRLQPKQFPMVGAADFAAAAKTQRKTSHTHTQRVKNKVCARKKSLCSGGGGN